jgi:hypothetical protein
VANDKKKAGVMSGRARSSSAFDARAATPAARKTAVEKVCRITAVHPSFARGETET